MEDNQGRQSPAGGGAQRHDHRAASRRGLTTALALTGGYLLVEIIGGLIANSETNAVHAFIRRARDRELEFEQLEDDLMDRQTGSTWDVACGIAVDGPLRGEVLQRVPYITAFDWAWEDFYPHSEFYRRRG